MCSNLPSETTVALLTPKSEIASCHDSIIGGGQIINFLPGNVCIYIAAIYVFPSPTTSAINAPLYASTISESVRTASC